MGTVALRIFIYSILPLLIAAGHIGLDKTGRRRERKLEILSLYLLGVGVAGSGIGGFFGHFFLSESVANSIGWPTGNPFQLEVAFAKVSRSAAGPRRDEIAATPSAEQRVAELVERAGAPAA